MNVRFGKRRNYYYFYADHSCYSQEDNKTKTVNKYLGADIKIAVCNLKQFASEHGIDDVAKIVLELKCAAQALGIWADD